MKILLETGVEVEKAPFSSLPTHVFYFYVHVRLKSRGTFKTSMIVFPYSIVRFLDLAVMNEKRNIVRLVYAMN